MFSPPSCVCLRKNLCSRFSLKNEGSGVKQKWKSKSCGNNGSLLPIPFDEGSLQIIRPVTVCDSTSDRSFDPHSNYTFESFIARYGCQISLML